MNNSVKELILKIRENYSSVGLFRRIFSWKDILSNIEKEIELLDIKDNEQDNIRINLELENISKEKESLSINLKNAQDIITKLENEISEERVKLHEANNAKTILQNTIDNSNNEILEYTKELHKVFKSSTGSQGKLSEGKLINTLRSMFGEPGEVWVENLQVENGRVELAMRPDITSDKWVPIDSKSLVPEFVDDETKEFNIDKKYISKVKSEAKKISEKYVNKNNTESYGIMVLPGENIFTELFYSEDGADLLKELLAMNVFLTSPSNFVQFLTTVYRLNEKIKMVEDSRNLVDEMRVAYKHMVDFSNATKDGLALLNTAYDKHLPNSTKKLESIKDQIGSDKKIK